MARWQCLKGTPGLQFLVTFHGHIFYTYGPLTDIIRKDQTRRHGAKQVCRMMLLLACHPMALSSFILHRMSIRQVQQLHLGWSLSSVKPRPHDETRKNPGKLCQKITYESAAEVGMYHHTIRYLARSLQSIVWSSWFACSFLLNVVST